MMTNMSREAYAPIHQRKRRVHPIDELFSKYEEIGFLYPAKKQLLAPHFKSITQHWKQLIGSYERLLWVVNRWDDQPEPNFASIAVWKANNSGLFAQHLVSSGNPFLSLEVMLAAQAQVINHLSSLGISSAQNWFRPNNRYAYRVFASMLERLGAEKASLIRFQYLHQALADSTVHSTHRFLIEEVTQQDMELVEFVEKQYNPVFVQAEELDKSDLNLRSTGELYQQYGLQLSRRIFKFREPSTGRIIACVIANRAPLGLNFSFLENRAYYIVDPDLSEMTISQLLPLIHNTIRENYADLVIQQIPILTDSKTAKVLTRQGAKHIRAYMQSIWLKDGFRQWYDHIEAFLQKIEARRKN